MVRHQADASFAALARRRADLTSAHFGLVYVMAPVHPEPKPRPQAAGRLGFSVPKRQLSRAVDRNALKRVAREAWRLAPWPPALPAQGPGAGSPLDASPSAAWPLRPHLAMLRLRRAEQQWKSMPRSAVRKAWRAELDELIARLTHRLSIAARQPD